MLVKSEKGRLELRPGHRSLGQRERALLLVADGQQSESQLAALFSGEGRRLLDVLIAQGYLERQATGRSGPHARSVAAKAADHQGPPAATTSANGVPHGEHFAGARSLASARMFLFDLSERLFAPRDKVLAARYRDALREARDPQAMLSVGRALIADVEVLAGADRADGISERLAKLLPTEWLEQTA